MSLLLGLILATATAFPSSNKTVWMRPDSFHLKIGQSRAEAVKTLEAGGWKAQKGKDADELIVDYSPTQSLTLHFGKDRLRSIRFELFTPLKEIDKAFEEEKAFLRKTLGAPKKASPKTMLIYDNTLPNVMAVVTNDPKSQNGRVGLGVLVVRYYDPASPATDSATATESRRP